MKSSRTIKNQGFTLIELMVVISIISLLASVILAGLTQVKGKARVSKVVQEVEQIKIALELYKSDYGHYPGSLDMPDYDYSYFTDDNTACVQQDRCHIVDKLITYMKTDQLAISSWVNTTDVHYGTYLSPDSTLSYVPDDCGGIAWKGVKYLIVISANVDLPYDTLSPNSYCVTNK